MLAASTLLYPRLKKVAFADTGAVDQCVQHLSSEMASSCDDSIDEPSLEAEDAEPAAQCLWCAFDQQVAEMTTRRTPTTDAVIEMCQYLQLKNIA